MKRKIPNRKTKSLLKPVLKPCSEIHSNTCWYTSFKGNHGAGTSNSMAFVINFSMRFHTKYLDICKAWSSLPTYYACGISITLKIWIHASKWSQSDLQWMWLPPGLCLAHLLNQAPKQENKLVKKTWSILQLVHVYPGTKTSKNKWETHWNLRHDQLCWMTGDMIYTTLVEDHGWEDSLSSWSRL